MKKIYSLSLVALFAISATAQQMDLSKLTKKEAAPVTDVRKTVQKEAIPYDQYQFPSRVARATYAEALGQEDTLQWMRPFGVFFTDLSYPVMVSDTGSVTFYDVSTKHTQDSLYWAYFTDEQVYLLSDSANQPMLNWPYRGQSMEEGQGYSVPSLATFDAEGDLVKSYTWSSGLKEIYEDYGMPVDDEYVTPAIYARPGFALPLTTCAMFTDSTNGTVDEYMLYDREGGWAYGTGLASGAVDTFVVIFDNLSTLRIDTAYLHIFSSVTNMIPAGAEVKIELVPAGMNQSYQWVIGKQVLSTATATQINMSEPKYNQGAGMYSSYVNFAFGTKNALGGFTPQPVDITGPFAAKLIVNTAQGNNFGIFTDYFYPEGQTFILYNGRLTGYGAYNMNLSLNAQFVAPKGQGIESVETNAIKAEKVIRDGQLIIKKGDKEFNVLGAQL